MKAYRVEMEAVTRHTARSNVAEFDTWEEAVQCLQENAKYFTSRGFEGKTDDLDQTYIWLHREKDNAEFHGVIINLVAVDHEEYFYNSEAGR